ncbi:MAG: hypothetical protein NTW21_39865 [Verrucomicrobia bacterium]|nr:hypothetical protein [Verrucomicrobiota bacterium]
MIEIRKYRQSRHWAVDVDGELLAVVVYRNGTLAIADMLMRMRGRKEAGDAATCSSASITTIPPLGVVPELGLCLGFRFPVSSRPALRIPPGRQCLAPKQR